MTLLSRIGYKPKISERLSGIPHCIQAADISVIVPVKNNQAGVDRLLKELFRHTPRQHLPKEILIVDNNSDTPIEVASAYGIVHVVKCTTPGPAAARNAGLKASSGSWSLFIDSDCIPTPTMLMGYETEKNIHVGYAGHVNPKNHGALSRYYTSQEILIPPKAVDNNRERPDYLVTANCLILNDALALIGGFDEGFHQAGGEDIDIAFRLLTIGSLCYQFSSVVEHDYSESIFDFVKRFYRYGKGNRKIAAKYSLDLRPSLFKPQDRSLVNSILAVFQFLSLSAGYHFGYEEGTDYLTKRA